MNSTVNGQGDTDSNALDPAKIGQIALQVVELLADKDSSTRNRIVQAALMILGESPLALANDRYTANSENGDGASTADLTTFFGREGEMKPSDNAHLCAAYHFSRYGNAAFSVEELKLIAAEAGVVLPDRVDMTLNNAAHKGKKLFMTAGKHNYKPTAAGAMYFFERWKLKPGKDLKSVTDGVKGEN